MAAGDYTRHVAPRRPHLRRQQRRGSSAMAKHAAAGAAGHPTAPPPSPPSSPSPPPPPSDPTLSTAAAAGQAPPPAPLAPQSLPARGARSRDAHTRARARAPAPPPTPAPAPAPARPRLPRGAQRRRSDPLDNRRTNGRSSGRLRGFRGVPNRRSSLECLQYVKENLLPDLPNTGPSEDSDSGSVVSCFSYSDVLARPRRTSFNADSGFSSSEASTPVPPAVPPPPLMAHHAHPAAPAPSAPPAAQGGREDRSGASSPSPSLASSPEREWFGRMDVPGTLSPDYELLEQCVVWYDGRNVLDLGTLLHSPWPLRPARLPDNDQHFFLMNRSQYHRLGPFGDSEPEESIPCPDCGFLTPVWQYCYGRSHI